MTESQDDTGVDGETEWRVVEQRAYERAEGDDLTTVIVGAVAAAEGVDITAVRSPPLFEVVDTAAVENGFFGPRVAGERRDSVGTVEFEYRGFRVTVRSDGWVQVAEPTPRRS
jgi:hypothetical protein